MQFLTFLFALHPAFDESLEQHADIFIAHTIVTTPDGPCLSPTNLSQITAIKSKVEVITHESI